MTSQGCRTARSKAPVPAWREVTGLSLQPVRGSEPRKAMLVAAVNTRAEAPLTGAEPVPPAHLTFPHWLTRLARRHSQSRRAHPLLTV